MTDIKVLENRLEAALRQGQLDQLPGLYNELLAQQPDNRVGLHAAGTVAMQNRRYDEAIKVYEKLVELQPDDINALGNLGMVALQCGRFEKARSVFAQALQRQPRNIMVLLYHGQCNEKLGNQTDAAAAYLSAARMMERTDSRKIPPAMRKMLDHASLYVRNLLATRIAQTLDPLKRRHGSKEISRIQHCADIFTGHKKREYSHPKWRPALAYIPGLPVRMFFEREEFPWIAELERHTDVIREELLDLLSRQELFRPYINYPTGSGDARIWKKLNQSTKWSSFHFFRHGERIAENCAQCPRTSEILDGLDLHHVPGHGPEVMFSVLRPHTDIEAHYGSVNGRLTVHLPLIVPENCGALRVGDQQRSWTEGECLIFDDSFEHEAWNQSDETRVVLILDTWNPDLSDAEREAFGKMLHTTQSFEKDLFARQAKYSNPTPDSA